jgi:hypothetical protein
MENIELSEGPEKALPEVITKRELWKVAKGQYDPLGLLCLVGEASKKVTDWDDPVPASTNWSPTWWSCGPLHSRGPHSPRKR